MWPYWLFFFLPALFASIEHSRSAATMSGLYSTRMNGPWFIATIFFMLAIGLRFEVGGDWWAYLRSFYQVQSAGFADVLAMGDPGYRLVNWVSAKFGWGVLGVNLASSLIFTSGLSVFSRSLPRPWLAMVVAVPYLVTVVAMGYTRQGVAIGFAMLALVSLGRKSTFWFVVWVLLGATFHKSAILLLPIAALANTSNRFWTAVWVGAITVGAYFLLLEDAVESLYSGYIEAEYQSQGAMIRSLMNAVPALILLLWSKYFSFAEAEARLWRWFAIISLALVGVLFLTPATTAVDRVALYMLPLQLVLFSHLPSIFSRTQGIQRLFVIGVVIYYGLVYFVWLNFAGNVERWLPYRNYLFEW